MADFKTDLDASYKNADRGKVVKIAAGKSAYIYPNVWKQADGSHDESNLGAKAGPLTLGTATGNYYRDAVNETEYLEVLTLASYAGASSFALMGTTVPTVSIIYVQPGQIVKEANPDYDPTKDTGNDRYEKKTTLPNPFKKETDIAKEGEGLPVLGLDAVSVRLKNLETKMNGIGKTGNPNVPTTAPNKGLTIALYVVLAACLIGAVIITVRALKKKD